MAPKNRRQYLVLPRRENAPRVINGRRMGKAGMILSDAKEARDIDQRYGHAAPRYTRDAESVVVVPIADRREQRQGGYKVVFGQMPEMPWKRKDGADAQDTQQEAKHGRAGRGRRRVVAR